MAQVKQTNGHTVTITGDDFRDMPYEKFVDLAMVILSEFNDVLTACDPEDRRLEVTGLSAAKVKARLEELDLGVDFS